MTSDGAVGVVELTVPAETDYLDVVRTATAGLAARSSFTFEEIEDLRAAVDAACVLLLSLPTPRQPRDEPTATMTCRFEVGADTISVEVTALVGDSAELPGEQSIAWRVLTAHVTRATRRLDEGRAGVRLVKQRR